MLLPNKWWTLFMEKVFLLFIIAFDRNEKNMRASLISCYILLYFHRNNHAISLSPGCLSWKDEFRRLYFLTPWDGNINNNGSPKGQRPPPWIDNRIKYGCDSNQYSPETIKTAHYGKVSCNTYGFFRYLWKIN